MISRSLEFFLLLMCTSSPQNCRALLAVTTYHHIVTSPRIDLGAEQVLTTLAVTDILGNGLHGWNISLKAHHDIGVENRGFEKESSTIDSSSAPRDVGRAN